MAVTRRAAPVDYVVAGYNVLVGAIWWANWRQSPYAGWLAIAHLVAATLPWLIVRAPRRRWDALVVARELYPLVVLLACWLELDLLRDVLGPGDFDGRIRSLDLAVFGVHLHAVLLPRLHAPWLTESMFFAYYGYYALIFVPPLAMAVLARRAALRDMVLRLMVVYLACYVVYIVFPVYGPHFLETPYAGLHTKGLFYRLVAFTQATADSHGCAFPSSHVAGAVTIALLGWRWFPRGVAAVLTVEALGVVVATVYTQNHYGIDSLAGIVWALAIQLALVPALVALFRPARARRRVARPRQLAPALQPFDSLGGGA